MKTKLTRCISFILLCVGLWVQAQELTGEDLLAKSIAYHDPSKEWRRFHGSMRIDMQTPHSNPRSTEINLNFLKQYFKAVVSKDKTIISYEINKGTCTVGLNGATDIPKKVKDNLQISCDRAKKLKAYYTYLYGLPMKLKDPGTHIEPKVLRKNWNGKMYLVLKASYDQEIGKDTWYFYFNPKNYALESYQFFHDEAKNDGEYILLSEIIEVKNMKLPKVRAWYYNKDNSYLGTDVLKQIQAL